MITGMLLMAVLSQAAIRRDTPQANDPGMVVRVAGTVSTTGGGGGTGSGGQASIALDGGSTTVIQGKAADGGIAWATELAGRPSTLNSTTTPLGAGASWTGTFEDVLNFAVINVTIYSDQSSAANGIEMQWSADGVNVDRVEPTSLTGGTGRSLSFNGRARWFRVKVTNGGTPQSVFRVGTIYRQGGTGQNNYSINQTVTGDTLAVTTKSVIVGASTAGGGTYVNVKVNPSGSLTTDATGSVVSVSGYVPPDGGVTAYQGTSPWVTSGTVSVNNLAAGTVTVDGGTVAVSSLPALPVGSNVIGKVSIDQTTPGTTNAVNVATATASGNPCHNPNATLQFISGTTSGTSAVQIVASSGSTKIFVCSVNVTGVSGTTPTFSLVYGTSTNCTGSNVVLGAWTTAANTIYAFVPPVAVIPASNGLCYLDTGTSPVQKYSITYVQL